MRQVADVKVIYDGQCIFCSTFSRLLDLDPQLARVEMIDARGEVPVEIAKSGLDVDQGMIVMVQDQIYHGADALHTVALLTSRSDFFNQVTFRIFGSKALSHFFYPALRCYRSVYLWMTNKPGINELRPQTDISEHHHE